MKIKPKVVASSAGAVVGGAVTWALATYVFHGDVPAPLAALVDLVVPGLAAGVAGWWKRDVEHETAPAVTK